MEKTMFKIGAETLAAVKVLKSRLLPVFRLDESLNLDFRHQFIGNVCVSRRGDETLDFWTTDDKIIARSAVPAVVTDEFRCFPISGASFKSLFGLIKSAKTRLKIEASFTPECGFKHTDGVIRIIAESDFAQFERTFYRADLPDIEGHFASAKACGDNHMPDGRAGYTAASLCSVTALFKGCKRPVHTFFAGDLLQICMKTDKGEKDLNIEAMLCGLNVGRVDGAE